MKNKTELLEPIHPGEILQEEFMAPLGLTINALSRDLHVPVTRISEIVNKRRGITGDTALRLARYFRNSAQFWLNLQGAYEIEVAVRTSGKEIERHVLPREAA
jgi:addiction module HigA family antidote